MSGFPPPLSDCRWKNNRRHRFLAGTVDCGYPAVTLLQRQSIRRPSEADYSKSCPSGHFSELETDLPCGLHTSTVPWASVAT